MCTASGGGPLGQPPVFSAWLPCRSLLQHMTLQQKLCMAYWVGCQGPCVHLLSPYSEGYSPEAVNAAASNSLASDSHVGTRGALHVDSAAQPIRDPSALSMSHCRQSPGKLRIETIMMSEDNTALSPWKKRFAHVSTCDAPAQCKQYVVNGHGRTLWRP